MDTCKKKRTILIIDDEPDLVDLIADELTDYQIEKAYNGREAIAKIEASAPDLIVSDVVMPLMDGLSMLRTLREKGIQIPVIFVTGFAETAKIREAWKLGAFDFLDKPVNYDQLRSLVQKGLEFGKVIGLGAGTAPSAGGTEAPIDPELRAQLEAAAKAEGMSVEAWLKARLAPGRPKKAG